jgi:hypothetical protein
MFPTHTAHLVTTLRFYRSAALCVYCDMTVCGPRKAPWSNRDKDNTVRSWVTLVIVNLRITKPTYDSSIWPPWLSTLSKSKKQGHTE